MYFAIARWLAVIGVCVNVWVLALHAASQALADPSLAGVICSSHAIADTGSGGERQPSPSKVPDCPICSGLGALHLALLAPEIVFAVHAKAATRIDAPRHTIGHVWRLHGVGNRGPPVLL